jgi:hypothetical protein
MSIKQTVGTFGGAFGISSPMLAASLGLRPDTYQFKDEMQTAWNSNQKQASILHREAVKNGLLEFWARKKPNLTGSALEQFVKARHPLLFDDAAKRVSGLNERQAANEVAPGIALGLGPVLKFVL